MIDTNTLRTYCNSFPDVLRFSGVLLVHAATPALQPQRSSTKTQNNAKTAFEAAPELPPRGDTRPIQALHPCSYIQTGFEPTKRGYRYQCHAPEICVKRKVCVGREQVARQLVTVAVDCLGQCYKWYLQRLILTGLFLNKK